MPGMFSKYGNRGRKDQDNQPEEITERTEFDLSNPSNVSSGGRYDLSGGVTDQMRYDYSNQPRGERRGHGMAGRRGGGCRRPGELCNGSIDRYHLRDHKPSVDQC